IAAGERLLREARQAAAARGLHLVTQFADLFLADSLTNRRELDEADVLLQECREQAGKSALWAAVWSISAARIARPPRDVDAARALPASALEVCGPLSPGYAAQATAILCTVEAERGGDPAEAGRLAREALRRLDEVGTWCYDVAIRVNCADVLYATGDH